MGLGVVEQVFKRISFAVNSIRKNGPEGTFIRIPDFEPPTYSSLQPMVVIVEGCRPIFPQW